MTGRILVERSGLAFVTDLGRTTGPRFGLATNGALDQRSAKVANVLVANDLNAPLIEITAFELSLRVEAELLIAVTGAELSFTVNGYQRPQWQPVAVSRGDYVVIGPMTRGLRAYLAIYGSVEATYLLDSCAPDSAIGFGAALHPGEVLTTNIDSVRAVNPYLGVPFFNFEALPAPMLSMPLIDVTDGPDIDEFGDEAPHLFTKPYTLSPVSNHIGLRFAGGPIPQRCTSDEKLSRGVPIGAVEVAHGDELLVLHRGRGVTAGYPVLGVVTASSLDTLAQVRPAQQVRFRRTDVATAVLCRRAENQKLRALAQRVGNAFTELGLNVSSLDRNPDTATLTCS
jgi:biotin-dependent carboxylase-like uncharacterized protein